MKTIFFGTPVLAAECLKAAISAGFDIVCVVTRADKPQGRGYVSAPSPVKVLAAENGIEVFQPEKLGEIQVAENLKSFGAELFLTAAYGKILPPEILSIPKKGAINIHASLLPKLRGPSPINRALLGGDKIGGVSLMYMDESMDTGDVILRLPMEIPDDMDFGKYSGELAVLGGKALKFLYNALKNEPGDRLHAEKQDHTGATYAKKITKEEMVLDFTQPATLNYNKVRALSPSPCARTTVAGRMCKIYKAELKSGCFSPSRPGRIVSADKNGIEIECGDGSGSIVITELQPAGKNKMSASAFIAGNIIER